MAVGPNHITKPCCLDCLKDFSREEDVFLCPNCNLPVCEEMCAYGEEHSKECEVFASLDEKIHIVDMSEPHSVYWSVTTLRALKLRESDPGMYSIIERMMSHMEAHARNQNHQVIRNNQEIISKKRKELHKDLNNMTAYRFDSK